MLIVANYITSDKHELSSIGKIGCLTIKRLRVQTQYSLLLVFEENVVQIGSIVLANRFFSLWLYNGDNNSSFFNPSPNYYLANCFLQPSLRIRLIEVVLINIQSCTFQVMHHLQPNATVMNPI